MALTYQQVAEICRQRLGLPDASANARALWVIPQALNNLARKVATSDMRRHLLWTDKATTTVTLDGSGKADLTTLIASKKIMLEFLKYGNIFGDNSPYPLQPVESSSSYLVRQGALADEYLHYYLEGTKIVTLNFGNEVSRLEGSLSLEVAYVPTLSQLPSELEDDFIAKVMELLTLPQNDYPEDGEK